MNILIPVDFSDSSRNALRYALALFGTDGHRYILLNAYEEPTAASGSMISLRDILHQSSLEGLNAEQQFVKDHLNASVDLVLASVYGDPVSSIQTGIVDHKPALVVMGTTGATGLKEVLIGSVASGVIQKVKCPVMVVPTVHEFSVMDKVLFAVNPQDRNVRALPLFFVEMLKRNSSDLTFISVEKEQASNDSEMGVAELYKSQLEGVKLSEQNIQSDHADEAIMQYATATGSTLIVTLPSKSSWFSRLLKHSVTRSLAHHLQIPMLALNEVD